MKKDEFISLFREYVRESISPTQQERDFVSKVYEHVCSALSNNCLQIGSYPRFTSIHPMHDLDVLYVIGDMTSFTDNPGSVLSNLQKVLQNYFHQNTKYKINVSFQTHSVTISFLETNGEEYFAIDVVPAFINGTNEFDLDTYVVPEILKVRRKKRADYYRSMISAHSKIGWIKSDPRGYIKLATNINDKNSDYRKAIKFAKKWKQNAVDINNDFKLKSFHIEQLFMAIFARNININIFDAVFEFFCHIPKFISEPQIRDRADQTIFIDSYLNDLTQIQKDMIIQTRDKFLVGLEEFTSSNSIEELLNGKTYKRKFYSEKYLFDDNIPTLIDDSLKFSIEGYLKNRSGFREYKCPISIDHPVIECNNFIKFQIEENNTAGDMYKWKVKNSDDSPDPRGEITDHRTKNDPESTKYSGRHYVECYAIKNHICISKDRIIVHIS
jgi:hypothetical protein